MSTHECYIVMLEMNDHLQALNIEEKKVTVEPTDDDTPYRMMIPLIGPLVSAHKSTLWFAISLPFS